VAVLSVIGFHAFPDWISGGFFGVDIFFVISGFLISTIILSNLERNTFSFIEFYIRRIRRIFPALVLMLTTGFCLGWFLLLPDEFKQLGKHIAGGAGFISNYLLWSESGYFDDVSETKPLLHLWSLGIEEQFYIIWPLMLWMLWGKRLNLLILISAVTFVSFAMNIDLVLHHATAAFYSPPTRFWELSVGSVLAYMKLHPDATWSRLIEGVISFLRKILHTYISIRQEKTYRNLQSLTGTVLILMSVLILTKEHPIPGIWALFPTLGALLVITAGSGSWPNRTFLANPVMIWFGKISYPLYLWHWLLLSLVHIVNLEKLTTAQRVVVVMACIALSWLTYQFIEKPLRFGNYRNAKSIILAMLMFTIGLTGYETFSHNGFGSRYSNEQNVFAQYFENSKPEEHYFTITERGKYYRDECNFYDMKMDRFGKATQVPRPSIDSGCFVRDHHYNKAAFIWGDSHAQQLYIGLKHNLPANWQILQVASSGCQPKINDTQPSTTDQCTQSNWFALKSIRETRPDVVIVAQGWGHNIDTMNQIAAKLHELGVHRIIFTGPTPHWTADLPNIIQRRMWDDTPIRTFNGIEKGTLSDNSALQENFKQTGTVLFANLIDVFCNKEGCLTRIGDDKRTGITSWDYGHLTEIASDYLAKQLLVGMVTGGGS